MKKIYTAFLALGLALSANAQIVSYQLDSSFNGTGFRYLSSSAGNDNIQFTSCYLNDDNSCFVNGNLGSINAHYLFLGKFKANGQLDSSLCNSVCVSGATLSSNNIDMYMLQNNFYIASSGYGGSVLHGLNPTTADNQSYDPYGIMVTCSAKLNDSVIIEGVVDNNNPGVFAYNARTAGSGYGGWNGTFTGTTYSHGGNITLPGVTTTNIQIGGIAVQSNNKIVIAGSYKVDSTYDIFFARFKVGTLQLDSTFGTNGIFRIIGNTTSGTNGVYSMVVTKTDTIYASYKIGVGGFPYTASILPNGGFNAKFNGGGNNTYNGQIPSFASSKLLITNEGKLVISANVSEIGRILNSDGSMQTYFQSNSSLFPSISNFNIKNASKNANGDILFVGSVDSNSISRGLAIKFKRVVTNVTPNAIAETKKLNLLNIYPNPASDVIILDNITLGTEAQILISTFDGKTMMQQIITTNKINIANLPSGMYMVQVKDGNNMYNAKISKL